MKIPIVEIEYLGAVRDFVAVHVVGKHINFRTDAMIDTGSSHTIISENDLLTKTE